MAAPAGPFMTYPETMSYVGRQTDTLRRLVKDLEVRHGQDILRLREDMTRNQQQIIEKMDAHDRWHRDQLTAAVTGGPSRVRDIIQVCVTVLSLLVAVVLGLLPHLH